MKVSHEEGGEMVRMHDKAAEYQEPEISTTFLKMPFCVIYPKSLTITKGSKTLLHSDIDILIWAVFFLCFYLFIYFVLFFKLNYFFILFLNFTILYWFCQISK